MRHSCNRILALVGLFASAFVAACSDSDLPEPAATVQPAAYVGRAACIACHETEAELWQGSHHDLAMEPADENTVRGNFDGLEFVYNGVTTTFFREDGKFMVRTDGPDGTLDDCAPRRRGRGAMMVT